MKEKRTRYASCWWFGGREGGKEGRKGGRAQHSISKALSFRRQFFFDEDEHFFFESVPIGTSQSQILSPLFLFSIFYEKQRRSRPVRRGRTSQRVTFSPLLSHLPRFRLALFSLSPNTHHRLSSSSLSLYLKHLYSYVPQLCSNQARDSRTDTISPESSLG